MQLVLRFAVDLRQFHAFHRSDPPIIGGDGVVEGDAPVDRMLQFAPGDRVGYTCHLLDADRATEAHDAGDHDRGGGGLMNMNLLPVTEFIKQGAMLIDGGQDLRQRHQVLFGQDVP